MSINAPPSAPASLEPALREIVGEGLTDGDARYTVDGLAPALVATPGSVGQLALVVAAADEDGAAVIPWGGGQHMTLGNVPSRYDVALRTTKLDRVLEYEAADLTVTVEAGITMGRLQAVLAEHGQFLPIDAPADATVGGVLAAGVSGPSRHAYGLPRDWLIGCRMALADGTLIKGGGRVVKNVAGYDLPKLAVGSLGTLGVIVEATFKVAPLPAVQETLVVHCSSIANAGELVFAADERGLSLRAVALVEGRQAAFWLAGPVVAVERTARELHDLVHSEMTRLEGAESDAWWARLDESPASDEAGLRLSASLPPAAVVDFLECLAALGRDAGVDIASLAYPTTGLVRSSLGTAADDRLARLVEQLRADAAAAGGSLVVTSARVEVKQRVDVWGDPSTSSGQAPSTSSGQAPGTALPLMRRLKAQFDPRGTLNPGRFVGGL